MASTPKKKNNAVFLAEEITALYDYLERYRDLSWQYCFDMNRSEDLADESNISFTIGTIGGHHFPPLNHSTCTQPFISLPSTLGTKHRKLIHDICLDIQGLYHFSLGPKKSRQTQEASSASRIMLVSIFVDGFEYHKDWPETSSEDDVIAFPVMRCKSWFYKNHVNPTTPLSQTHNYWSQHYSHTYAHLKSRKYIQDETNQGLRDIKILLEQPEKCLRDDVDIIHWDQIQFYNLSHISPPCLFSCDISESFLDESQQIQSLLNSPTFLLVDTVEKIDICVRELNTPLLHELAFDVEVSNPSKFAQVTCLLQISSNLGKDYVIDVLAPGVWDAVPRLKPYFANPSIVKIGHNIGPLDISSLHRDFGIFVVNAFDTQVAAETLRLKSHMGLAKLCEYYELPQSVQYQSLKNTNQMRDWRKRPLTPSMLLYGSFDVHYLVPLRRLLLRDLCKNDESIFGKDAPIDFIEATALHGFSSALHRQESVTSTESDGYFTPQELELAPSASLEGKIGTASQLRLIAGITTVIRKSLEQCLQVWKAETERLDKNETFVNIFTNARRLRTSYSWTEANMALYQVLVEWRDTISRPQGLNPCMVIPFDLIIKIAYRRPRSINELRQLSYILPEFFTANGNSPLLRELFDIVSMSATENYPLSCSWTGTYGEYVRRIQRKVKKDMPLHLNILRWTLVSSAVITWLTAAVRKNP